MSRGPSVRSRCAFSAAAALGAALLFAGCGQSSPRPELSNVSGRVTLDDQPLPGARVRFQPLEGGRLTIATTDADGRYSLQYTEGVSGAIRGRHLVQISTGQPADEDGAEAIPEKVPPRYNRNAEQNPEMTVEVQPGSNEFNFALKSGG